MTSVHKLILITLLSLATSANGLVLKSHGEHGNGPGAPAQNSVDWGASVNLKPVSDGMAPNYEVALKLKDAQGAPVNVEQLEVVHTEPMHLLIIDETFTDYHHIHPKPDAEPGTYRFQWHPKTTNAYAMWVDITDKTTHQQRYIRVPLQESLKQQKTNRPAKTEILESTIQDITGRLILPGPLKQGQAADLKIELLNHKGQTLEDLEPIMGAYAHLVGFYDDFQSLAHLHPIGEEPQTLDARGGSPLSFMLHPEETGTLYLFLQIKYQEHHLTLPFKISIAK